MFTVIDANGKVYGIPANTYHIDGKTILFYLNGKLLTTAVLRNVLMVTNGDGRTVMGNEEENADDEE